MHDLFKKSSEFTLKMATRLVFAGRWTEKRYHSKFVSMSKIKYYNTMTFSKDILCGCTGKSILFSVA